MRTILIVDDEALVRLAIRSLADWPSYGYDLRLEASNGLQALEILEREPVDLVLTDLKMPGLDGFGVLEAMQQRGYTMPVVVLSAHNDYENVRRAFRLGACDYIVKTEMQIQSILSIFADALSRVPPKVVPQRRLSERQQEALWSLLAGAPPPQPDDIQALHWHLDAQHLLLVSPISTDAPSDQDPLRLGQGIEPLIEQTLKPFTVAASLFTPPDTHCILLAMDAKDAVLWQQRSESIAARIKSALSTYFNLPSAIGISRGTAGFCDIPGQYQQALSAIQAQRQAASGAQKRTTSRYSQPVASALAFMEANYSEEITLKSIADHVFLSESYFSALFSREVKASFTDTLMGIRIENAKTLLETSTMKAYEVAARVGFVSTEHFHRTFKKLTGSTPHAFRNGIEHHRSDPQ